MNRSRGILRTMCFVFVLFLGSAVCFSAGVPEVDKKVQEAEKVEQMREEAAKAKREAAAKAKAKRQEKARRVKLDKEARKEAKAQNAQAKSKMDAQLKALDATAKKQAKELAQEIKAEKAKLKSKFEKDKAQIGAEYKAAKAQVTKKERAKQQAEVRRKLSRLESDYKKAVAGIEKKADAQTAQIAKMKRQKESELKKLDAQAKKQAQKSKAEQADLNRKYGKNKAGTESAYKKAKAKVIKKEKPGLQAAYKRTVKQLDAEYNSALTKLNKDAKVQAVEISQEKKVNKAELKGLDNEAKKQAKAIKTEGANLKRNLAQDKSKAAAELKRAKAGKITKRQRARLEGDYKKLLKRLDADYKEAVARLKERGKAEAAQVAQKKLGNKTGLTAINARAKRQAQDVKAQQANIKRKLAQDKADARTSQDRLVTARVDAEYKERLSELEAGYKESLAPLEEKAKARAEVIAQAKLQKEGELAALDSEAVEQARETKAEKEELKDKLVQDKAEVGQYGAGEIDAEYKQKLAQLEAEYNEAIYMLDEKAEAQTMQVAEQRRAIKAEYKTTVAKTKLKLRNRKEEQKLAELELPVDTTQRFTVRQLSISGNMEVPTDELLEGMPLIYNVSGKPLKEAEGDYLYDFRVLHDVILSPGAERQVSSRTIQGFTRYILSVYQERNYGGIYVYVPARALRDGRALVDDILAIRVLEAQVTDVTIKTYDPNQVETEEGYLRRSAVEEWSPVKAGQVANQKKLDDFVNLLNLNPDRYVSAVVSKGREPETLAVAYDIYEANPWHYFIQADNSGTSDRQWNPRFGVINTNLFGIDDTFTAIYQAPVESDWDENYSLYGSYDFPLAGPRLRLNIYGGHSEFDINPEGGTFDFLGRGTFYGGVLRYNLLQKNNWFLDIKGSMEHVRSKVNPSLFTAFLGTDIKFWLWGYGVDLHRSDDMSNTSLTFDRYESWGGESDATEFGLARNGSKSDFSIYVASAAHSQYMDPNKVQRLSTSFKWTGSNERLVPAKMTSFGGMYSVRGYDEYEVVADGGILASVQYEFDLVQYEESKMAGQDKQEERPAGNYTLEKLAPVIFADYGRTTVRHPIAGLGEQRHVEMISVGTGLIVELGEHFTGAVYYGYPLRKTTNTRIGKGRVNAGILLRW